MEVPANALLETVSGNSNLSNSSLVLGIQILQTLNLSPPHYTAPVDNNSGAWCRGYWRGSNPPSAAGRLIVFFSCNAAAAAALCQPHIPTLCVFSSLGIYCSASR